MSETLSDYTSELSLQEKEKIIKDTFKINKTDSNTISNLGDYFASSFDKIDGFDYRWNSLITSKPLLFEDSDYLRCRDYINNTITEEEIAAYKRGELHEIYATFENMLMCNLQYYDRIMSFCTMVILHYVRIDEILYNNDLDKVPFVYDLTPTKIWCCALSGVTSTNFELCYGWGLVDLEKFENKSYLESNWDKIYKNISFRKFVEYCAIRTNTKGFRQTLLSDKTNNKKLAIVCSKFTRTSVAVSDDQLNNIYDYIREIESINVKLYSALQVCLMKIFNNDESQFAIYIFSQEFYIHTSKFSMKVSKDDNGKITKDYLANSYECFIAEESLSGSIKAQIDWAKYKIPANFEFEKQVLTSLLNKMVIDDFKHIVCIKRMNEYGTVSKVTFSGIFNNLFLTEQLMYDNHCIKSNRICLNKENTAQYLIDRGYYLFGIEKDILELPEISRNSIVNHYLNYCVPIINHMKDVITAHVMYKNDIIDVVCSGTLNPNKLNNKNIKFTNMKSTIDSKKLMNLIGNKNTKAISIEKKSYWKVIE